MIACAYPSESGVNTVESFKSLLNLAASCATLDVVMLLFSLRWYSRHNKSLLKARVRDDNVDIKDALRDVDMLMELRYIS